MRVETEKADRWYAARERAGTQPAAFTARETRRHVTYDGREWIVVEVDSASQPNTTRSVVVSSRPEGIFVECNCPGGLHGLECWHGAVALMRLDLWWAVDPAPTKDGKQRKVAR
jgi:hypothetical protein